MTRKLKMTFSWLMLWKESESLKLNCFSFFRSTIQTLFDPYFLILAVTEEMLWINIRQILSKKSNRIFIWLNFIYVYLLGFFVVVAYTLGVIKFYFGGYHQILFIYWMKGVVSLLLIDNWNGITTKQKNILQFGMVDKGLKMIKLNEIKYKTVRGEMVVILLWE